MTDEGRPQDQGRRHRRAGKPSAETATLLAAYQTAMRDELRALLDEIAGTPAPAGLLADVGEARTRPTLAQRGDLWALAVKLARELGTEVDTPAPTAAPPQTRPRRTRKVDMG